MPTIFRYFNKLQILKQNVTLMCIYITSLIFSIYLIKFLIHGFTTLLALQGTQGIINKVQLQSELVLLYITAFTS